MKFADDSILAALDHPPRPRMHKAVNRVAEGIAGLEWILLAFPVKDRARNSAGKRKQDWNATARGPTLAERKVNWRVDHFDRLAGDYWP